jgi:TolB-like protein/DNA-binding winged helix-turn-helix (wHTH) protein/tetratricopeptide (TPR) repeat protein
MDIAVHRAFRFAGYTLDMTRGALRNGEHAIELRPKSFEVLRYLVENAGRLISKDEIIQAVWSNVVVSDESLTRCISDVRAALADEQQRIIKTVPRRGYILDVQVSETSIAGAGVAGVASAETTARAGPAKLGEDRPLSVPPSGTAQKSWRWLVSPGALVLLLAGIAAGSWFWRQPAGLPLPERPSIAVLPFINMGTDPQQDYFSDGITEDIITNLSKFSDLFVIAHNSTSAYKGKSIEPRQIGRELGVHYLLQGSVRRQPDQLRITAQLIDATNSRQIWAEHYDRVPADIFAIQDEVTQKLIVTLVARISKSEFDRVLRKPPQTLAAYDYYLRGNAMVEEAFRGKRGENIGAARAFFEQAIASDPRYAVAVQALARTYLLAWLEPTAYDPIAREYRQRATLDRALSLAQEAVALDGNLSEAHTALAWVLHWQYRRAESMAEYQRAFELNPNLAERSFAPALYHNGRTREAIDYMRRIMRLDPFHPAQLFVNLGAAYYLSGSYTEALGPLRTATDRMPDFRPGFVWRAAAAAQLGLDEEARRAASGVLRLQPDFKISEWLRFLRLAKQEDADRLADGLRKAGLPE